MDQSRSKTSDFESYYQFLQSAPASIANAELKLLQNCLTVGETYFFRDLRQFEAIKQILKECIAQKRQATPAGVNTSMLELNLWSAGCATGEEPYSLAILLHQLLPDLAQWKTSILGTDINNTYLERAKQGLYSDWSFRDENSRLIREKYFTPQNNHYALNNNIRGLVSFQTHNLMDDFSNVVSASAKMDLILCRNVSIYFKEATSKNLIDKFQKFYTLGDGSF